MKQLRLRTTIGAVLVCNAIAAMMAPAAMASSHREAPFITKHPKIDATDFYMFRSYQEGRSAYTTLIANYVPLQDPYGGPNYFMMDPEALYEIHVDNNADAVEDITFQFRFKNQNKNTTLKIGGKDVAIPLVINGGAIADVNAPGANVRETFTVNVVRGNRRSGTRTAVTNAAGAGTTFDKPLDNVGKKAIPNYEAYAAKHIYEVNIPGCAVPARMFVGQRKDSFVVNLGETFDLINIKAPAVEFLATAESNAKDDLRDKNVTTISMEVPTACLISTTAPDPVIGAWTTASLRQGRLINPSPKSDADVSREGGAWTQVSRLGMPLVNEVVIGLKDKDRFNASKPAADGQFADYVTNPTLPALIEILYGDKGAKAPTNFPRNDLVAAFLTGIAGVNKPTTNTKPVASEMLRLDTSKPITPAGAQKRLGVVAGDNAGFPNGRRPGDDVVDIALRVVMGKLCTLNIGCAPADAPAGAIQFTDGAFLDEKMTNTTFPYLKSPIPGSPQM
ncbi:MAG: DUF4331 domain-containing protein [Telluria sp.]